MNEWSLWWSDGLVKAGTWHQTCPEKRGSFVGSIFTLGFSKAHLCILWPINHIHSVRSIGLIYERCSNLSGNSSWCNANISIRKMIFDPYRWKEFSFYYTYLCFSSIFYCFITTILCSLCFCLFVFNNAVTRQNLLSSEIIRCYCWQKVAILLGR